VHAVFGVLYAALNAFGALLDRFEADRAQDVALAANLMLTATRPATA
jgi:hypothetical protein